MTNSPGHAWYIRHSRTGGFLFEGSRVVFDPREATQFATRDEAVAALAAFTAGSATFPPCDVIDQTIPEPATPDLEPLALKSFEEVLAEARARSAQVRNRAAAAGGGTPLLRTAPSPRPIIQPSNKGPSPRPYGVGRFGLILQPKAGGA